MDKLMMAVIFITDIANRQAQVIFITIVCGTA